jgi:N-acetylneuraminic acid mutarotase
MAIGLAIAYATTLPGQTPYTNLYHNHFNVSQTNLTETGGNESLLIQITSELKTENDENGGNECIYAFRGDNKKDFWKYEVETDEWTELEDAPEKVKLGGSLIYTGENYLFALRGDNKKDFWKYDISSDEWTVLEETPEKTKGGASLVFAENGFIYAFRGNNKKDFWKYDISTDSWIELKDSAEKVKDGGFLVFDGMGAIYAFRGDNKKDFWKYDIDADSWAAMQESPEKVHFGASMTLGNDNYIYSIRGNEDKLFWRYDINSDNWEEMENAPEDIEKGGSLSSQGSDHVFALRGNNKKDFWRYDISTDSWNNLEDTPENVKDGGSLAIVPNIGGDDLGSIGNYVWYDEDKDGLQGNFEFGVNDIKVYLYHASGVLLDSVFTAVNDNPGDPNFGKDGYYIFESLESGDYYLKYDLTGQNTFSFSNVGTDDNLDSDVDGSHGHNTTAIISLGEGQAQESVDAGFHDNIVPVTLISFEGRQINNNFVKLDWITASEINNKLFQIERKIDEGSNQKGIYYYRLRQVDFNGEDNYSETVAINVNVKQELELNIFPNPTVDFVQIKIGNNPDQLVDVFIYDGNGNLLMTLKNNTTQKSASLDVQKLVPGIYHVVVQGGTTQLTKKMVKVK